MCSSVVECLPGFDFHLADFIPPPHPASFISNKKGPIQGKPWIEPTAISKTFETFE